jgi:hypothetical protein
MAKGESGGASPEIAVRTYLTYLQDPTSLVDNDELARLEKEVAAAQDPIERLIAMAALHRAKSADPSAIINGFTKNARAWAEAEGVPESAFREMGVPDDVLRAAGFGKGRPGRAGRAGRGKSGASRRPKMGAAQLKEAILALDGPFTIRDVSERIGGSPVTVKSVLAALESAGKIRAAGEKSGGRGRAAKTWTAA